MMKFGALLFFSWPERRVALATVYQRALQRAEIMDQTGYDAVWLAEHHFTAFSICPSVHMMATYIAARTKRVRIGTGISLVPFYQPLRLAEEVAMLDVLSGGRVNWGAGRGYQVSEYTAFNVPPKESYQIFREYLQVVLQAWTTERLTYQGRYFQCHDVQVLPKPVQQPHPPVWLAAASAESITWAGQHGFSILLDPVGSHQQMRLKYALYKEQLAAHGFAVAGRDIPVARLLCVDHSMEQARAAAMRGLAWYVQVHKTPGSQYVDPGSELNRRRTDIYTTPFTLSVEEEVDWFLREATICGTPAACIDQIARLRDEIPMAYLLCAPLSHRSFMLFTEQVLPHFL
jgi:alkanesulfonate monooxygenase SsuD/methylene tetrahydromethanopterin reductase-like flavin-dependent oxidoreductase (luciferase family)